MPGLLRALLGWRGRLLDEALRDLAGATGAGYCPISLDLLPDYLAIDGFHPSQLGYQVWAGALADWLAARERRGSLSETQDTAPRSLSRVSFRHSTASRLSSAAAET